MSTTEDKEYFEELDRLEDKAFGAFSAPEDPVVTRRKQLKAELDRLEDKAFGAFSAPEEKDE